MSYYKEQSITLHHVTEYDQGYENKWFEIRIGENVIGRGDTMEEACLYCDTAENIDKDLEVR